MRIWPCCVSAAWRYAPAVLGVCLISVIACGGPRGEATDDAAVGAGAMTVESAAFANGGDIPARYTCEGENVSPPLTWEGTPDGAVTLALICDDPDAPLRTYSHWVLYDLPPETADLPEAVPSGTDLAIGGMQGRNDFGDVAYGGPCPPSWRASIRLDVVCAGRRARSRAGGATRRRIERHGGACAGHRPTHGALPKGGLIWLSLLHRDPRAHVVRGSFDGRSGFGYVRRHGRRWRWSGRSLVCRDLRRDPRMGKLQPVYFQQVTLQGGLLGARQDANRAVTLPEELAQCRATGRIDIWALDTSLSRHNNLSYFWDSDAAKWLEAVGYSLATHPDAELEAQADEIIELIAAAQGPDGYLNTFFTAVRPGQRWTNLRDLHELYCAGHLIEAAVAYYQGTGKRKLLDVMCRYADYIATVFGPEPDQKRGYPGHPEIELALVRLYRVTGRARYLHLSKFFVDERGTRPHYYDREARARGEDPAGWHHRDYRYSQSHVPVREQEAVEGHAVRAVYLYSGMADVAAETGDETLLAACERLWKNLTERRMYVTGSLGSAAFSEGCTYDYDLPNDTAYAETCAAIGLVFWMHRMVQATGDSRYADTMERALYNGVLSGVSLDGGRFFYANPLEVVPEAYAERPDLFGRSSTTATRQPWFDCACCPPNVARLMASLGEYIYSTSPGAAYVHLYTPSCVVLDIDGQNVTLEQETDYPWDGHVRLTITPDRAATFGLALRLPEWCPAATVEVNGAAFEPNQVSGYLVIEREWAAGDLVTYSMAMPAMRLHSHPAVRATAGMVALQRGPLVYCLEEIDNGPGLHACLLPADAEISEAFDPELMGGMVVLRAEGLRVSDNDERLYRPDAPELRPVTLTAVPYFAWDNRGPGGMRVWIRESQN